MPPSYRIDIDPPRKLISLRLVGQWDMSTVVGYRRDVDQALAQMKARGGRPGEYLLLVDLTEHGVQSRDVAAAFQEFVNVHAGLTRRRATVLSQSALHKMQAERLSQDITIDSGVFRSEQEALAWLFS